ncbi:uncharacterized protein LOC133524569 [Cydia pomonella]|uniref:uncharacterized protein LOC133524569 n=1 Tax=Cydia pomonella TaxID=82600 RepID=UPI002ADE64B9|nr:uncharacterized protein LOC133524569 [Cydia pomonella]
MVSFDVTSLFTNVPVDKTIGIISNLVSQTNLPAVYMEAKDLFLKSGYLMWHGEYYLQVDGVDIGLTDSSCDRQYLMEWFEENALNSGPVRPKYWWRYVDDVFTIVSKNGLRVLTEHLNTRHHKSHFTVEEKNEGKLPFLDVLVMRKPCGRIQTAVEQEKLYRRDGPEHFRRVIGRSLRRSVNASS